MHPHQTEPIELNGVPLTHERLTELIKLADMARPFYDWVELQARQLSGRTASLSEQLLRMTEEQLVELILRCQHAPTDSRRPRLLDGVARPYSHSTAVYYFFAWLARDAARQRLNPLITRAGRGSPRDGAQLQARALAKLLVAYRSQLATFEWPAIREVLIARLEGSRRSIRGRRSEAVVRTALGAALQSAYEELGRYGRFADFTIPEGQVTIHGQTFDVSVVFHASDGAPEEQLLIPVKTRETEGGGHSHLFTRDIDGAVAAVREAMARRRPGETVYWLAAFIVAEHWSEAQVEHVLQTYDFAVALRMNPNAFTTLMPSEQERLDEFVLQLLEGEIAPKAIAA